MKITIEDITEKQLENLIKNAGIEEINIHSIADEVETNIEVEITKHIKEEIRIAGHTLKEISDGCKGNMCSCCPVEDSCDLVTTTNNNLRIYVPTCPSQWDLSHIRHMEDKYGEEMRKAPLFTGGMTI